MRTVSTARRLESLDGDVRRLLELAGGDLTAPVPTCPGWTLADLVEHVATVFLHKVETMRLGGFPEEWPPERTQEAPRAYLQRAYAALAAEFAARSPGDRATTWFEPDQTVGFWIRRMAWEAAIHRVDAELAAAVPITAIPDDVAIDAVDEVLETCLVYASVMWPEDFGGALPSRGETILLRAGGSAALITLGDQVTVADADPATPAETTIDGSPMAVLLWLWRAGVGEAPAVAGSVETAAKFREFLRIATQ